MRETLRYLGAGEKAPDALRRQVTAVAEELTAAVRPRWTYRVFSLERTAEGIRLAGTDFLLPGKTAERMLAQCGQAALFACTLGAEFDARLRSSQARDMAGAVILDACGSAWVEQGCDRAEREIAGRFPGMYLTDRFSPGYGDLPLSLQPAFCALLDVGRRLGVSVTDRFLMVPTKSVTAVAGLSDRPQMARIRGCEYCSMQTTCALRKRGMRCAL
ncbi:MAG: methionine synthase [Oscillibacter sp.]|nr:methionine synthase [Oscillibacter sp.]